MNRKHCYKATFVPCVATHLPAQKGSQLKSTRCHTKSTGMGPGTLAKELGTTLFFVKVCAGQLHIRATVFRSFLDQHPAFQLTLHMQAVRYTLCCRVSGMNHCLSQCIGHSLGPENALLSIRMIGKIESWSILSCLADQMPLFIISLPLILTKQISRFSGFRSLK